MSSSVSPLAGGYFAGMSSYASSLNNQISQEVQLAELPIQVLQNDVTTLTNQSSELQTLNSNITSVQSAISGIASAVSTMLTANLSGASGVTATVGSSASAGTYTISGITMGTPTDALSVAGVPPVSDPTVENISSSNTFSLTVGTGQPITVSGNSLDALAQSIDGSGAGVQASVVNIGSNSSPDYRLSLESDQMGAVSIQLSDSNGANLISSSLSGNPAAYSLDGQPVTNDSNTVTLAEGLTVSLTANTTSDETTTITVAANPATVGQALQTFVNAYNSAMTELAKNIGQSGGALSGQSVVYELTNALQSLANYSTGSGTLTSMSALGLTFNDTSGQLSFSQSAFSSATSGETAALQQFLGSAAGGGFLQQATNTMNSLVDPVTGILTGATQSVQSSITSTNQQITNQQNQVTQLQQNLTQQMSATDAMIYSLQQQSSYFQQMFASEQASETAGLA